jgi:hypothetical protein
MKKGDLERYKMDHQLKLVFFSGGLLVAFVLALVNSDYATAAFAFVGGLVGGSAFEKKA